MPWAAPWEHYKKELSMIQQVTIIGLGLIGGSLGLALTNNKQVNTIVGHDINISILQEAVSRQAISWGTTSYRLAVEKADVIVLAVPVGLMKSIVQKIIPYLKDNCIITDMGSTKSKLSKEISQIIPQNIFFVGGHPMAGSEQSGICGAVPYLFENAIYCLTPDNSTNQNALETIKSMVEMIGAQVKCFTPDEHDLMVAGISHLPHMIAVSLVDAASRLANNYPDTLSLAAGGFRDTTRIAAGSPIMWRDISLANKDNIVYMIDMFQECLEDLKKSLHDSDVSQMMQIFNNAQQIRQEIPIGLKGLLPRIYEIVVTVPDEPGMLSMITGKLGQNGVNISEIEILRVREGEGGTIRLAFKKEESLCEAMKILQDQGLTVKRR